MRLRFLALLALLAIGLLPVTTATTASPAQASCAAPMLDLAREARLARGVEVTVTGRFFTRGCDDTGACTVYLFGCQSCEQREPSTPLSDLTLQVHQRGRTWDLATSDADDGGTASWTFRLPREIRKGPARLTVDGAYAEPARVRIR